LESAGVKFDVVSKEEWLEKLGGSEKDVEKNPAVKLLVSTCFLDLPFTFQPLNNKE
jgi:hypothetical protein